MESKIDTKETNLNSLRNMGYTIVNTSTKTFPHSTSKPVQMRDWIKENYGSFKDVREKADIILQEFGCWFKNKSQETGEEFYVLFYKYLREKSDKKKCVNYKKMPYILLQFFHKKPKTEYEMGEQFDIRLKDKNYLKKHLPSKKRKHSNGESKNSHSHALEMKMETITQVNPAHLGQLVDFGQWNLYDQEKGKVLAFVESNTATIEKNSQEVQLYDHSSIQSIQTEFMNVFDTFDRDTFDTMMQNLEEELAALDSQKQSNGMELAIVPKNQTTGSSNAIVPSTGEKKTRKRKRVSSSTSDSQATKKKQSSSPPPKETREQKVSPNFESHFWTLIMFRDYLAEMSGFESYDHINEEDVSYIFKQENMDDLIFVLKMFVLLYIQKHDKLKIKEQIEVDMKTFTLSYFSFDPLHVTYTVKENYANENTIDEDHNKIYRIFLDTRYFLHDEIISHVKKHHAMLGEFSAKSKIGEEKKNVIRINTKNLLKSMNQNQIKLYLIFMNKWFPLRVIKKSNHIIQNYLSLNSKDIQDTLLYID